MGGFFFTFVLMERIFSKILLALYFFCYTLPQNFFSLYIVFDRMSAQILFLSILNIIVFLYLFKDFKIEILKQSVIQNHFLSFVGFIIISLFSILVAVNQIESLVTIFKYIVYLISFISIILLSKFEKNFLNTLLIFTTLGLLIETLRVNYTIYESVIQDGNLLLRGNKFRGFTGNINISSFAIAIKIPLVIYLYLKTNIKVFKFLLLTLIFSSFTTICLLMSRGAFLITLFIVCLAPIMLSLKKEFKFLKAYFVIPILFLASFYTQQLLVKENTPDQMLERFSTITDSGKDESVNERLIFYRSALQSIKETPILGVGIGNWKLISIELGKEMVRSYRIPYFTHNDYLQITAEIGLIGGILFTYFILFPLFFSLRKFFKTNENLLYLTLTLTFIVYGFDSLINFPLDRPVNVIYFLFSMTLLYTSTNKIKNAK